MNATEENVCSIKLNKRNLRASPPAPALTPPLWEINPYLSCWEIQTHVRLLWTHPQGRGSFPAPGPNQVAGKRERLQDLEHGPGSGTRFAGSARARWTFAIRPWEWWAREEEPEATRAGSSAWAHEEGTLNMPPSLSGGGPFPPQFSSTRNSPSETGRQVD